MLKEHPKGLMILAIANMGERFGYYTMLAILALYIQAKFGLNSKTTSLIYGTFLALVYFLPLFGGLIADKFLGYGKTILLGVAVMFGGYALLAIPSGADTTGYIMMFSALFFIALGTGFFKGNLQALVGNLYEDERYSSKRDIAFSIFYMFINIGAFFAPSTANLINNSILEKEHYSYDAAIPTNVIKLNDKVVNVKEFSKSAIAAYSKPVKSSKDSSTVIREAKKKAGVIFQSDKDKALLKIKAAALVQSKLLSPTEYRILEGKNENAKASVNAKINRIPFDTEAFGVKYMSVLTKSYNWAFGVACGSLLLSVFIFLGFGKYWRPVDYNFKQQLAHNGNNHVVVLTPKQVRERVSALIMVFIVVIFFWMSFHQNGLCMTYFARDYTVNTISPLQNITFSLMSLIPLIFVFYGIYIATGIFGSKRQPVKGLIVTVAAAILVYLSYLYNAGTSFINITPQIFQQFNPFFIVLLTPLMVALFTKLNKKGKEPSAPRKIGIGMVVAALGFIILIIASIKLPAPSEINGVSDTLVSPNWLISTYFVLTIAELFLSPMGISFVAKVAPPQYKGIMQGGWLAATAIGNYLVGIMGTFWDELPLWGYWSVLVVCCLISATFIFSILKRLERVTNEA